VYKCMFVYMNVCVLICTCMQVCRCMHTDRRVGLYECARALSYMCLYVRVPISMVDNFISRMSFSMCTGQCHAAP